MNRPQSLLRRGPALVLAAALAAGALAACGSSGGAAASSAGHAKLKSILFVNPLPNYPQWQEIGACAAAEAKKLGIKFTQDGPTGSAVDMTTMVSLFQQGIADQYGAIATFPVSGQAFQPLFQQARKQGILVASLYGAGSTTAQNVDVGLNFAATAQAMIKFVAQRPGVQNVGYITGTATAPDSVFTNAMVAAARKTSNVKVADIAYDNGDLTQDVDIAVNMMTAHPQINMFVSNEGVAPGVIAAIKQKNAVGKVFVVNTLTGAGPDALSQGILSGALLQDVCGAGQDFVAALAGIADGKKEPKSIGVGLAIVNAKTYPQYKAMKGWM